MSHWRKCGSGQEGYHVIVGKKTDSKMGPHPERDGNPRAYAESIHAAGIARNGIRHGRSGKDGTDIACHDLASGQKPREDRIRKNTFRHMQKSCSSGPDRQFPVLEKMFRKLSDGCRHPYMDRKTIPLPHRRHCRERNHGENLAYGCPIPHSYRDKVP